MRWTPSDDDPQREKATNLTRTHNPFWWVVWGSYSRVYTAYWLGPGVVVPVRYADPEQLVRQMRYVAHAVAAGRTP